ncbi:MAG: hypothetical protein K5745_04175 [Saccharofermentans sp.]|nr:hypothetical protein [Saccharofermentans sp.]
MNKRIMATITAGAMLFMTACSAPKAETEVTTESAPIETEATAPFDYVGTYVCDRATIYVENGEPGQVLVTVMWGNSELTQRVWTMSGDFNVDTFTVSYSNGMLVEETYDSEGVVMNEEAIYTDGTGIIKFFEDGTLTWQDDVDHQADEMVFEMMG